jgi:hypothetical protein
MKLVVNLQSSVTVVDLQGNIEMGLSPGNEFQWNVKHRTYGRDCGPEPDLALWRDSSTGLVCMIKRGHYGHLCGYVGVPNGHKLFGLSSEFEPVLQSLCVHGGVTFSGQITTFGAFPAMLGFTDNGLSFKDTDVWFIGFDAAHSTDLIPMSPGLPGLPEFLGSEGTYKDFGFMREQCTQLAKQIFQV